jgi:acyl carrier protein
MHEDVKAQLKKIVARTVGGEFRDKPIPDDLKLVGNILDSMAVTNLIVALEEGFGVVFEDEDLSAEAFETIESLSALIGKKLSR